MKIYGFANRWVLLPGVSPPLQSIGLQKAFAKIHLAEEPWTGLQLRDRLLCNEAPRCYSDGRKPKV